MRWMVLALPLVTTGCEGTCETVDQAGPGLSGTLSYTTGDGARVEVPNVGQRSDTRRCASSSTGSGC